MCHKMLMWVSNCSFIISMIHIWSCFLFLFCPSLFVPPELFLSTVLYTIVCTPSLFQLRMRLWVRERRGQRPQRVPPTPPWRRSSPRLKARTPERLSREPTPSQTSTNQMCLAESSQPLQLRVTFKQNTCSNSNHF